MLLFQQRGMHRVGRHTLQRVNESQSCWWLPGVCGLKSAAAVCCTRRVTNNSSSRPHLARLQHNSAALRQHIPNLCVSQSATGKSHSKNNNSCLRVQKLLNANHQASSVCLVQADTLLTHCSCSQPSTHNPPSRKKLHLHQPALVCIAACCQLLYKHRAALVLRKHNAHRLAQGYFALLRLLLLLRLSRCRVCCR